jgi:hypothetical protein
MSEKLNTDYLRVFITLLFFSVIAWPFLREVWSKEHRKMLQDMKGENNKWDWSEIWEYTSLRFARGFFFAIMFMILMLSFYNIQYPWELYVIVFCGTLGSNGIGAFLIYIKSKNEK